MAIKFKPRWGWTELRQRSLAIDSTLRIALVGASLAILIAAASLPFIRGYETERQLKQVGELLSTVESTLRIACFVGDKTLAAEIANGLLSNRTVAGVRIKAGQEVLADVRKAGAGNAVPDAANIVKRQVVSPFDSKTVVGEVELLADSAFIRAEAVGYANLSVIVLLLEVVAVACIVAFIIMRRVVRPILMLSASTHNVRASPGERVPPPPGHKRNEIGLLVRDFNELIDDMASLLSAEQAMREKIALNERRFRTLAENTPDIIARYDRECRRVFVNPAYVLHTGTPAERVLNRPTDDADIWRPTMPREEYKARLHRVMDTGEPDHILLEWLGHGGEFVSHEMYVVAEHDSEGKVIGTLAIGRDVTQRKAVELELTHQATHDALTGLPNRFLLKDRLQQALVQAHREARPLAVVFVDLDNFKTINDTLGHAVGDELLKTVAYRMSSVLRGSDTVARLGGDEFVILLHDGVGLHELDSIARKIFETVCCSCDIAGHHVYTNASMGIAVFPQDGADVDALMRNADTAMYVAKSLGRNNYQFFSSEMNEEVREWMEMSTSLRVALENQEFELHYQPKACLKSGTLSGMEALIRWRHPERGMISPTRFIPVAEECGLIGAIGAWVLDEACRQIRQWQEEGLEPRKVAVNLSAAQCRGDDIQKRIKAALETYGLRGDCLEVEITESIVMHDADTAIRTFWELREMGVHVAIDDFGTGYSSLSYLKKFPIESLKIDKSFVDDIDTDPNDVEIICAIIAMAHSLGLSVVAEGVETAAQLDFLRRAGCNEMQGYYFSRPIPAGEMATMLRAGQQLAFDDVRVDLALQATTA
jgi:diguanylate cyclase (GGDEF)-like protein/PAS domain S-box-containing protein